MLKKSIITIFALSLILPAANILAEEMGPKPRKRTKKQPVARIQKLEERLERIEKMLQRRIGARQKAQKGNKQQPKEQPQRKRFQQGRQQMGKWFDELEKAYDQKNMKKIGQLIKRGNKFRQQMKKRRAEFRQGRPRLRKGTGDGLGHERRFGDWQERRRFGRRDFQGRGRCFYPGSHRRSYRREGGRRDRGWSRRRDFQDRDYRPYRNEWRRGNIDRPRSNKSEWDR